MRPELQMTFSARLLRRNLAVAAVVGTILNAINQGDAILLTGQVELVKAALTYCVPFLVASYGSYHSFRAVAHIAERGKAAAGE